MTTSEQDQQQDTRYSETCTCDTDQLCHVHDLTGLAKRDAYMAHCARNTQPFNRPEKTA